MIRMNNTWRRGVALALVSSLGGLVLAGCGSDSKSSDSSKSTVQLKSVASVTKLVPAEFKSKTLNNAVYSDLPPEEFMKGNDLVGIQPDIADALGQVMGVKIKNIPVGSFDSLIPGTVSGRYDMSSADFGVTAERLKQVDFVTEFKLGTAFAVKKGSSIKINEATDLCGHSVGVLAGSYFIDQVKTANSECLKAGKSAIDLKTFPNDGARTLAVTTGRVDVTATAQDNLAYTISSQNVPLAMQKFVYQPLQQAIVLPNESKLGPAMEAAMKELVSNGTYAKILKKWGVESVAYTSPDEVLYLTDPSQTPS